MEPFMPLIRLFHRVARALLVLGRTLFEHLWRKPATALHLAGRGADLVRSKQALIVENMLVRHQLIVLRRSGARPRLTATDRALFVLLAGRLRTPGVRCWSFVQPATLLRWHRAGFRLFRRWKSRSRVGRPPLPAVTASLIKEMAANNPLWGAEGIRGGLLKLGIRVAKRTTEKYMRGTHTPRARGQTWTTFLRNQTRGIWACDFLQTTDLLFRPVFAFFIIEHARRRVVHLGVTRHPTAAWVTQQLREATPYDQQPRDLIRDNDATFGPTVARVAKASGIKILRTPVRAPRANALAERFLGSVRRECLEHILILGERHLHQVLHEYAAYFNRARPHQGLHQAIPQPPMAAVTGNPLGSVRAVPVLGGLHHEYQRAA
jgi:putative transposase